MLRWPGGLQARVSVGHRRALYDFHDYVVDLVAFKPRREPTPPYSGGNASRTCSRSKLTNSGMDLFFRFLVSPIRCGPAITERRFGTLSARMGQGKPKSVKRRSKPFSKLTPFEEQGGI